MLIGTTRSVGGSWGEQFVAQHGMNPRTMEAGDFIRRARETMQT
jgi:hypothetical protein